MVVSMGLREGVTEATSRFRFRSTSTAAADMSTVFCMGTVLE